VVGAGVDGAVVDGVGVVGFVVGGVVGFVAGARLAFAVTGSRAVPAG